MVAIRTLATICTYIISLCGIIPLLFWLATLPRLVLLLGLLIGIWQDRKGVWLLKPWMQNAAVVPFFLYYALQFSRSNLVQPVISVLAILLAVRLSGEKTVRHSLQIYALSIFCLASSSLFSLSPVFLFYLGFLLFVVAIALVLLTFQNQDQTMAVTMPNLKKILLFGILIPLLSIPLLLFFFPIMPRTQQPLWNFLNPPATRTSGYSDTVEPGSQSSITESRTLAFRAEMPRMPISQLYWRGTVFNRTDGNRWTRSKQVPAELTEFSEEPVRQTIYLEPSTSRTMIALDRPSSLSLQRLTRSPDGVFEQLGALGRRFSYSADSEPGGITGQRNKINNRFYQQLPEKLSQRIMAAATQIMRAGKDDRAKLALLENYFRNGGYRYTTRNLATGDRALEQFLFEKKQGHCEFFASSFALLLRAAGVPSRLVGGYLGGDYNELGGYYFVTDDKAHVWVEAFITGSGWVRIDPSSFAANAGDVWRSSTSQSARLRIHLMLDSLNHAWNRNIISYDLEQQVKIAREVSSRLQGIDISKKLKNLVPYFTPLLLLSALLVLVRFRQKLRNREQRILHHFLKVVESEFGIKASEGLTGLFEIASAADNSQVSEFVDIFAGTVYRDRKLTDDEYLGLKKLLRLIKSVNAKKT